MESIVLHLFLELLHLFHELLHLFHKVLHQFLKSESLEKFWKVSKSIIKVSKCLTHGHALKSRLLRCHNVTIVNLDHIVKIGTQRSRLWTEILFSLVLLYSFVSGERGWLLRTNVLLLKSIVAQRPRFGGTGWHQIWPLRPSEAINCKNRDDHIFILQGPHLRPFWGCLRPQSWIRPPRPKIANILTLPSSKHDHIFILQGPHMR